MIIEVGLICQIIFCPILSMELVKCSGKFRGLSSRSYQNKNFITKTKAPTKPIFKIYIASDYDRSKTIFRKTTEKTFIRPIRFF